MNIRIDNVGEYLKEHGIKPSYQRMRIFQYLLDYHNHPTVDIIYKALCPEIPTLSKTTVYNTLNLFVEKKIVNVIIIEENETRYDLVSATHGHFKCQKCGVVYDVELQDSHFHAEKLLEGCQVEEKHFYFKGICKDCMEKKQ